jgi:lambda family phage portal protein
MIKKLLNRFGYHKIRKRQFAGADTGRLYSSWTTTSSSADAELKNNLRILRARSRELTINNDYAKKFIRMVKTNVIGKAGIILQSKALTENKKPDELARTKIEDAFKKWSKKGVCDITGKYSFRDVQNIVMTSIARDGEVLIRIIRNSDNDFGFSLQLLEADHLDDRYNDTLSNGNHVKMGVEYNKWGKPVGYWIFEKSTQKI